MGGEEQGGRRVSGVIYSGSLISERCTRITNTSTTILALILMQVLECNLVLMAIGARNDSNGAQEWINAPSGLDHVNTPPQQNDY